MHRHLMHSVHSRRYPPFCILSQGRSCCSSATCLGLCQQEYPSGHAQVCDQRAPPSTPQDQNTTPHRPIRAARRNARIDRIYLYIYTLIHMNLSKRTFMYVHVANVALCSVQSECVLCEAFSLCHLQSLVVRIALNPF